MTGATLLSYLAFRLATAGKMARNSGQKPSDSASFNIARLLLFVIAFSSFANGHNWIMTPSRARFQTSTQRPFPPYTPSRIHAQVGPGQKMAIKVSTAHSGFHRFVIIARSSEHYTFDENYESWVDDYIDNSPGVANLAYRFPRFHHCGDICLVERYSTIVSNEAPDYCDHPDYPSGSLYRYRSSFLENDKFVFYSSNKYPWIAGAIRFPIVQNDHAAHDVLCIPIPVPVESKESHFVVHWYWNGYSDAIDVLSFRFLVPPDLIYGEKTGNTSVSRIDHCQFEQPARYATPLHDASEGAQKCISYFEASNNPDGTFGINVVPLNQPEAVFTKVVNGPWDLSSEQNYHIADAHDYIHLPHDSPIMKLQGTVMTSSDDWEAWKNRTVIEDNKVCVTGNDTIATFKRVTLMCADSFECQGISWMHNKTFNYTNEFEGEHQFRLCKFASSLEDNPNWRYYKKELANINNVDYVEPIYISFEPIVSTYEGTPVRLNTSTPPSLWKIDTGEIYGDRGNNETYGWNCPMDMTTSSYSLNFQGGIYRGDYRTGSTLKEAWGTCPDGETNEWNIDIPNGVYKVTLFMGSSGVGYDGCLVENLKFATLAEEEVTIALFVSVRDEKLTLSTLSFPEGPWNKEKRVCPALHWIKLELFIPSLQKAWVPHTPRTEETFWSMQLYEEADIGLVSIRLPGVIPPNVKNFPGARAPSEATCSVAWLLQGNSNVCIIRSRGVSRKSVHNPSLHETRSQSQVNEVSAIWDINSIRVAGRFNTSHNGTGVLVYVSNSSFASTAVEMNSSYVCSYIDYVPLCKDKDFQEQLCLLNVLCPGIRARYVHVKLLGPDRILAVDRIDVHRNVPQAQEFSNSRHPLACVGVQIKPQGPDNGVETYYKLSDDPTDPIFYSTCYLFEPEHRWLPFNSSMQLLPWYFTGGYCLNCSAYAENLQSFLTGKFNKPTSWQLDAQCFDCTMTGPGWIETNAPTRSPTVEPPPYVLSPFSFIPIVHGNSDYLPL